MGNEITTSQNPTTTVLPATSSVGDSMSESNPPRSDGTTPKMPRVVVGGDANAYAIIDPLNYAPRGDEFGLITREIYSLEIRDELRKLNRQLYRNNVHLSSITEIDNDDIDDDE